MIFQIHDAMIDIHNLFELKQTLKFRLLKILLAYNMETDCYYLIQDFFYHGGTSPTKFLGRYISSMIRDVT